MKLSLFMIAALLAFGAIGESALAVLSSASFASNKFVLSNHAMAADGATVHIPKDSMGKGPAAYGANPLVVPPGTQVTWTNDDTVAHTVTADDGSFDSGFIMPEKSYSRTFSKPGKYPYYCTLHGKQTMSGVVEVK